MGAFYDHQTEADFIASIVAKATAYTPHGNMIDNTVYLYTDLYQLLDVDEKMGLVNAKIWMYLYYYLPDIAWDPADYGGLDRFTVPKGTFWIPDISKTSKRCTDNYLNSFLSNR